VAEAAPLAVARSKACSLSQARMLAPPAPRRLSAPGALMSISSGMGTSSTVSRESSRSRFGHSFLIYTPTSLPRAAHQQQSRAIVPAGDRGERNERGKGREGKGRPGTRTCREGGGMREEYVDRANNGGRVEEPRVQASLESRGN
jgi:hypothetical protein